MEDRFKFRVWNKVHKKMYPSTKDVKLAISLETMLEEKHLVVMRCTGIKDSENKLIYEDDVVELANGLICGQLSKTKYSVKWEKYRYNLPYWVAENETDISHYVKIIGNIWENPELLESNNND